MPAPPRAPDTTHRSRTQAETLSALERLRKLFPLELALQAATPAQRHVYARILASWVDDGVADARLGEGREALALAEQGALVLTAEGIGCYPFSVSDTGIQVAYNGGCVHALCAVDALAIPRLVGRETRLSADCVVCTRPLACVVAHNGALEHDLDQAPRVMWGAAAQGGRHGHQALCRHIRFLCAHCPAPPAAQAYTLAQAAVIGNAFFAFQRGLLADWRRATGADGGADR